MTTLNKKYTYIINGNRVEISKEYRTRTQYEYFLKIFMGDSEYESILNYRELFLTKKYALNHAIFVIVNSKKARIEKISYT